MRALRTTLVGRYWGHWGLIRVYVGSYDYTQGTKYLHKSEDKGMCMN